MARALIPPIAIASQLDLTQVSIGWLYTIPEAVQRALAVCPERPGAVYLHEALKHAKRAQQLVAQHYFDTALPLAMSMLQLVWVAELTERNDLINTGTKMTAGRQPGAVGKVRLAIRAQLKRTPKATAAQVWEKLSAKPSKGLEFYDSPRLGRYIETSTTKGTPHSTGYARFVNLVSEEKKRGNSRFS